MKITFVSVGSTKKSYLKAGIDDYLKRINRYVGAQVVAVKEGASSKSLPKDATKKAESGSILKNIKATDFVIALDDRGRSFSSKEFAAFIADFMSKGAKGRKDVVFVVGGAFGLHDDVAKRSDMTLSLSKMTLPHELALLTLTEQVYRAYTMIKGEPYSH